MRILNAMFGRKKGGIEQAFIDYTRALSGEGHEVVTLTYPDAPVIQNLPADNSKHLTITNFGQFDPIAVWKLKQIIKETNPDIIITHGNRATTLLNNASKSVPVVGVCHNYNLKHLMHCDALITITNDLRKLLLKRGKPYNDTFCIPNMIYIPKDLPNRKIERRELPIIGAMGRFVEKKGFHYYLESLKILKDKGLDFKAVLAGEGVEEEALKEQAKKLNIDDKLEFVGWVEKKEEFFESIDIFCVPSLHEPFGIVLLEAMLNQVPLVTTDTEGPIEIVRPYFDCMMAQTSCAKSLSMAIERFILDAEFSKKMSDQALNTVKTRFSVDVVGRQITSCLEQVCAKYYEDGKKPDLQEKKEEIFESN